MADEETTDDVNETPDAPEAEAPVAEAPAEEAPAEEPAAEPVGTPHPKELRRKARSTHSGEARPQRTPEERVAARAAVRAAKAKSRSAYRVKARAKARERRAAEPAREPLPPAHPPRGAPKLRQGVVVSDKADKTITVRVDATRRHRRYEKTIRSSSTLHAHDERNDANAGDTVRIVESRPLSRRKRWRLVEVVERAK